MNNRATPCNGYSLMSSSPCRPISTNWRGRCCQHDHRHPKLTATAGKGARKRRPAVQPSTVFRAIADEPLEVIPS